jgi:hypothetical protein
MNRVLPHPVNDQSGAALVAVMMLMLGLTALGIMAMHTGSMELDGASNYKFHQIAFFAADGACDMTTELIGKNIETRGFATSKYGKTLVKTPDFFSNAEDPVPNNNKPDEINHDIEVPNLGDSKVVYLKVYGNTRLGAGSALQMAAGYDGVGKSLAGGGAQIVYEIRSSASGPSNSQSRIWLRWLQMI